MLRLKRDIILDRYDYSHSLFQQKIFRRHLDNPHPHRYLLNKTGGTAQRSKIPEPLNFDNWLK